MSRTGAQPRTVAHSNDVAVRRWEGRGGGRPRTVGAERWPRPPLGCCTAAIRTVGRHPARPPERGLVRKPHRACSPPLRVHRCGGACRRRSTRRTAPTRRAKSIAAARDLIWACRTRSQNLRRETPSRWVNHRYVITYHLLDGTRWIERRPDVAFGPDSRLPPRHPDTVVGLRDAAME